jgi:N-acetylglutamate synthase-like GNAT family acetyltransferase
MPAHCDETVIAPALSKEESVCIRRFQPGDEASFLRLNEEWIVRHFVLEEKDREVLGNPVKYILNPGGVIVFATVGQETVGCCALAPIAPGEYEVAKMAVTPTHRGLGIGRLILEAIIAAGRELGATRLYLETNAKLPAATYLYKALGFEHVPEARLKPSLYSRADVFMEMFL